MQLVLRVQLVLKGFKVLPELRVLSALDLQAPKVCKGFKVRLVLKGALEALVFRGRQEHRGFKVLPELKVLSGLGLRDP